MTLASRLSARYLRLILVSITIGLAVALAVKLFKELVRLVSTVFYGSTGFVAPDSITHAYSVEHLYVLGLPALGGLAVGLFVHKTRQKYGVPETIASAANKDGAIPAHAGPHTAIANSLSLGSGTSAGSEGPLVQIGAAVGSLLGKASRLSKRDRIAALAAGGGASFAVLFGAPLAGVFFAMEVILRTFRLKDALPLGIATFTAVAASNILGVQALHVSAPTLDSITTVRFIIPAIVLALLGAGTGTAFVRLTHSITRYTRTFAMPVWLWTTIGGLAVGSIAWFFPRVLGIGQATLGSFLAGEHIGGFMLLAGLALAKIAATGITLGSGIPGGCLFPSLFIGAAVGAALGEGLQDVLLPGMSTIFALIGAASVLAVVVRAPLAGILLVASVVPSLPVVTIASMTIVAAMSVSHRLFGGISMYGPALAAQNVPYRSAYTHVGLLAKKMVKQMVTNNRRWTLDDSGE